jgi:glycosyltransferase involved in cell wall biosynthesis
VGGVNELASVLSHVDFRIVSSIDTEEIFPLFTQNPPSSRLVIEAHTTYVENLRYLKQVRGLPVAGFLVPTAAQAKLVAELIGGVDKVTVVPNPIREIFTDSPNRDVPRPPRQVVAWIGRLDEHKNWKGFLDVASRVTRPAAVEWWIVGDNPDPGVTNALRQHATALNLLARLRWLRKVPHERMPLLLDMVRESGGVTITTSLGESFGLTVIEAMARGCTVVVPASEPFADYVTHSETGLCYDAGSVDNAARYVQLALLQAEVRERCGAAARRVVLNRYAPSAVLPVLARELRALV